MKTNIHPEFHQAKATCVCGNTFEVGSTVSEIKVEICAKCHPFYTGQQKIVDSEGRVQRFLKAVEPPGDARPEWEFLHELVHSVTGQDGFVTIEGLFNQMAKEVPGFSGLTWAALGNTGVLAQI